MQATKRSAAQSDVWAASGVTAFIAPPGTPMSDSAAWTQIGGPPGASFVNGRIQYDEATRDWLASNYCIPQTFVTGITSDQAKVAAEQKKVADLKAYNDVLSEAIGVMARECSLPWRYMTGLGSDGKFEVTLPTSNASTPNERSKPVGLTKEYRYDDPHNSRRLEIERSIDDNQGVYINVSNKAIGSSAGIWLRHEDTVPLALNVLGRNRPELGEWALASTVVVRGDGHRDEVLAQAAANLRAIDLYDQHLVKKKADEEAAAKAAEIAAAKARVEVANREIAERHLRKAKAAYLNAVDEAFYEGDSVDAAAKLQAALSSYETARRKFEGLPS